jgi:hypothetical protein
MQVGGIKATAADAKELELNIKNAASPDVKMWSHVWLAFELALSLQKPDDSLKQFREGFKIAKGLMEKEGGVERLKGLKGGIGYEAWEKLWAFYGYAARLANSQVTSDPTLKQDALDWVREAISMAPAENVAELQTLEKEIKGQKR